MRSLIYFIYLLLAFVLNGCVTIKPIYPEKFDIDEEMRAQIEQARSKDEAWAITRSVDGKQFFSNKGNTNNEALRTSLSRCSSASGGACHIMAVGRIDFTERYKQFNEESTKAIRSLRMPAQNADYFEKMDWQIDEPVQVRSVNEGIHFATPSHLEGVKNILTAELLAGMKDEKFILLDASTMEFESGKTIPNAYVMDWLGVAFQTESKTPGADTFSQASLEANMRTLAPRKDQAIVVFCTSPECWLSVNGLLRLRALGYTNLFWYRGGTGVWSALGLPLVPQVPYASMRHQTSLDASK